MEKAIKRAEKLTKEIIEYLKNDNLYFYLQHTLFAETPVLKKYETDFANQNFSFLKILNLDDLYKLFEELRSIDVDNYSDENIKKLKEERKKQLKKERKKLDKDVRKLRIKALKESDIFLIQKIADYLNVPNVTNENSLDNLNADNLDKMFKTYRKIQKIMMEYNIDDYDIRKDEDVWNDIIDELKSKNNEQ